MTESRDETMIRIGTDVLDKLKEEASGENRSAQKQLDYILRQRYEMPAKPAYDADEAARQIKSGAEQKVKPNGNKKTKNGSNG